MEAFNPLRKKLGLRKELGLVTDRASDLASSDFAKFMEEKRKELSQGPKGPELGPMTEKQMAVQKMMEGVKSDLKPPSMTGGFESKPISMTEEAPKKYSLGADTDLKKALEEGESKDYTEVGSAAIKGGAQALGTVAKEAAAQRALESEMAQKSAIEEGRAGRASRQRAGRGSHRALSELIASFRSASQ